MRLRCRRMLPLADSKRLDLSVKSGGEIGVLQKRLPLRYSLQGQGWSDIQAATIGHIQLAESDYADGSLV